MLDKNCPNYSLAYHAGSFRLSVAIVVFVSGEAQHGIMDGKDEYA